MEQFIITDHKKVDKVYHVAFNWGNCTGVMQIKESTLLKYVFNQIPGWIDFAMFSENWIIKDERETLQQYINTHTK